jgi:hypothetical protein
LSRETNIPVIRPKNNITANTMPRIAGSDRTALGADVAGAPLGVGEVAPEFVDKGLEALVAEVDSVGVGEAR